MRTIRITGALAVAAVAAAGCQDITNPVEEFGTLADPYVRFEDDAAIGTPGSLNLVIFQLPTRVEEDVTVEYSFGGDAVFGEDYQIVTADGTVRDDVTADGGTAVIPYDTGETSFARDTVYVFVPFEATDGRTLQVEIASATSESGTALETGYIDDYRLFTLAIEGFVEIAEGSYTGQRTGDFGEAAADVTITSPDEPIVVDGAPFSYELSDYTGDGTLFGAPIPWAFSVTSGGTVIAPVRSHVFTDVTSDVVGSYDFDSNTLTLDIELTCCGAEGATWSLQVAM